jgi:hypothetical protein
MDTAMHSAFEAPRVYLGDEWVDFERFSARVIIAGLKNLPGFRVPQMSPPSFDRSQSHFDLTLLA